MIWVAWRQHRNQALTEAAALGMIAVFLIISGLQIAHTFQTSGLAHCLATVGTDCGQVRDGFSNHYNGYQFLIPLFLVAPLLFGMLIGAPLIAREIENGTHRLAWTQGITRRRWLSTKVAFVVGLAAIGSAALAALVTWWSAPLVASSADRFKAGIFDLRGVVPIAYAIFAVMLGVAIGSVVKKTLPAIGLTIVSFAAVRVGITLFLRQHYLAAKTVVTPFLKDGPRARIADWVISQNTVDRLGNIVPGGGGLDFNYLVSKCPGISLPGPGVFTPKGTGALNACVQHLGLQVSSVYQPASRFWTFQWIEFAIFIVLSAALAGFLIWRAKRIS